MLQLLAARLELSEQEEPGLAKIIMRNTISQQKMYQNKNNTFDPYHANSICGSLASGLLLLMK
jgi:hypothetical protein